MKHKKTILLIPILLSLSTAYALPTVSNIAYPPYIIKPNTPATYASGLTPSKIKLAYSFTNLPFQGAGQTIAIVDAYDDPKAEADLGVFSKNFRLAACTTANGCFKKVYAAGSKPAGNAGWGVEISLDIQWAHAIAPKAKIILVEAKDSSFNSLFQAISVAITQGATVVSMSWGGSEFAQETGFDSTFNVPNVVFTASSGDGGHGTIYPSVSPNVIAVGGTTLTVDASGNYLSENAWSGSGGGVSVYEKEPTYQTNFPLPNNPQNLRGVPDISYNADPNSGFSVYDSYGQPGWMVIGGTSAGSPQIAAMIAVAKSGTSKKLTTVNSSLYAIGKSQYLANFHPITTGTNGSCGYYCTAIFGYNYVTGIGTPQAASLVYQLIQDGLSQ